MSQILRLFRRTTILTYSNTNNAPCLACISLRNGWHAFSTKPQVRVHQQIVKKKKKWKKKNSIDLYGIENEQFKLTQVLDNHLQNLNKEFKSKSDFVKQTKRVTSGSKETKDASQPLTKKSSETYRPGGKFSAIKTEVPKDSLKSEIQRTSVKDVGEPILEKPIVVTDKLSALKTSRSKPFISYQTTHFDQLSRENAKKTFAYKNPADSGVNLISVQDVNSITSHGNIESNIASESELKDSDSGGRYEDGFYVYDETEWESVKAMTRKRTPGKLLTLYEIRELEMGRDKHLEKLEEPEEFEENFDDVLSVEEEPHSVEGIITNKAIENQAKVRQKQQKLEMKKMLQSKSPEESIVKIFHEKRTLDFNNELKTYVDACISCGLLDNALSTVQYYRLGFQQAKHATPLLDVEIYNLLLRGLTKLAEEKGSTLEKTRKVFSWIREDGLKPNVESFCLCLASIGLKSDYDLMMASFIVKDMRTLGFDIHDVFNQCTFMHNERHKLLKIFKLLIPGYKPNRPNINQLYEGPLLEKLNDPLPVPEMAQCNSLAGALTADEVMRQTETQFSRELDGFVKVESIYPQSKLSGMYEQRVNETVEHWRKSIKDAFIKTRNQAKKEAFMSSGVSIYPFLCLFPLDDYVHILTMEAQTLGMYSQHYSPEIKVIYGNLARHVHTRYMIQLYHHTGVFNKLNKIYKEYIENLMNPNMPCHNQRLTWKKLQLKFREGNSIELPDRGWSWNVEKKVGKVLLDVVLKGTSLNSNLFHPEDPEKMVAGFNLVTRMRSGMPSQEVMPHPVLFKLMNPTCDITFPTEKLPMLCPPVPYTSSTYGGNFINTVETVRRASSDQERMFKEMSPKAGPVFDALNVLSACAWQINKPVLEVAIKMFRDGGNADLDIPILPASIQAPVKPKKGVGTKKELSQYYKNRRMYEKTFSETTSLWWTMLYKLSIANKYKNETFWFPMNMDFRGRTYTVAPHLNHQGDDVNRGLIQFAKGKALGERGFDWLKIHLVNLTGRKKRESVADRLKFCEEIMPKILDSADNPLTGEQFWTDSDDPWQTLAACLEVAKALRSGNPESFVSKLPVHQDGSCNGLQHYAALGRDDLGAKSVNLHPLDVPSDVYSEVLEQVKKEVEKDIQNKHPDARYAKICQKYIERKIIKQSVMTTVYGVTSYGARHQIARQLKYKKLDDKYMLDVSTYLTKKTFQSLNEMFESAKKIQDWFDACAKMMASLDMRMEWVTPLNFPIIQPYKKRMVHNNKTVDMSDNSFIKVDGRKQVNAFAPNFIHSLDATHMMLTALDCHRQGITFISVHDCFWTHPAYVEIMNKAASELASLMSDGRVFQSVGAACMKLLSPYFTKRLLGTTNDTDLLADLNSLRGLYTSSILTMYFGESLCMALYVTREQFVLLYKQPILENLSQYLVKKCLDRLDGHDEASRDLEEIKEVLTAVPGTGTFELDNVLQSTYFFS